MRDYVGCMIKREEDEMFLHQTNLIEKLEREFGEKLSEIKAVDTLVIAGEGIIMAKGDETINNKAKHTKYRSGTFPS